MSGSAWTIAGAEGEPIFGDAHAPRGARGVVLLAHGFKGYKDYGMFPLLAASFAKAGYVAHRFNFSRSGMTNRVETFERPDLFERDTWSTQVRDLRAVIDAVRRGDLAGEGLPLVLFGHSRGGATALLTAGRLVAEERSARPAGVIAASAPSRCLMLSAEDARTLLERGFLESPSSRTGQVLRIGRAFLEEQLADPEAHDLPAAAAGAGCPVLLVHGAADMTVPCACAAELAAAIGAGARVVIVDGADHVFNTPNPMPEGAAPSPQLAALIEAATAFLGDIPRFASSRSDDEG